MPDITDVRGGKPKLTITITVSENEPGDFSVAHDTELSADLNACQEHMTNDEKRSALDERSQAFAHLVRFVQTIKGAPLRALELERPSYRSGDNKR